MRTKDNEEKKFIKMDNKNYENLGYKNYEGLCYESSVCKENRFKLFNG